jgi:hypothetical protein
VRWKQSSAGSRSMLTPGCDDHGHIMCVDARRDRGGGVPPAHQPASRPQLHTHAVIANRVLAPDGRWLAFDARTIKVDQRTLSALYHAGLASRADPPPRRGMATPEHGIAEIARHPEEVLAHFSQRTTMSNVVSTRSWTGSAPTWDANRRQGALEAGAGVGIRQPTGQTPRAHPPRAAREWRLRVRAMGIDPGGSVEAMVGRRRVASTGIDADRPCLWSKEAVSLIVRAAVVVAARRAGPGAGRGHAHHRHRRRPPADRVPATARRPGAAAAVSTSPDRPARCSAPRDGRPITEAAVTGPSPPRWVLDEEEYLVGWAERRKNQGFGRPRARPIRFADHPKRARR